MNVTNFHKSYRLCLPFLERIDASAIEAQLGVIIPSEVRNFWECVPPGYYGNSELCVYGGCNEIRNGLSSWNQLPHLRRLFPPPVGGGPVFIADTCFGDQIGFRWEDKRCIPIFLDIETMEMFVAAKTLEEMFSSVLPDITALIDTERLRRVVGYLGSLPAGKHFAPIQSPLIGGNDSAENYHVIDPVAHIATTVALYEAAQNLPTGTKVKRIELEIE